MRRDRWALIGLTTWLLLPGWSRADLDETRLLLEQIDRREQVRERRHAQEAGPPAHGPALITIDGQTYQVADTLPDLKAALYVALNLQQWGKAAELLRRYRRLPGHEPETVAFARGMLARQQRDYPQAIDSFRAALAIRPEFTRVRLELARALFEDNRINDSRRLFRQTAARPDIPPQTRPVIAGYLQALDEREAWHGSLSFGMGYNSNINRENGSRQTTLWHDPLWGDVTTTRKMPDPIGAAALSYSATASKRWALAGHHGLSLRLLDYGRWFGRHKVPVGDSGADPVYYDDNTFSALFGYQYADAKNEWTLASLFEHYHDDRHGKYRALGWRLDGRREIGSKWSLSVNWQHKRYHYLGEERRFFGDYTENSFGINPSYLFDPKTMLYGGLTYTRRTQPVAQARNREWMLTAGIYRMFDIGINANASAIYRHTRYDASDGFLGGLRRDHQQVYLLDLTVPRLALGGWVPGISWKYVRNDSSISWAYDYDQSEILLKLEKTF